MFSKDQDKPHSSLLTVADDRTPPSSDGSANVRGHANSAQNHILLDDEQSEKLRNILRQSHNEGSDNSPETTAKSLNNVTDLPVAKRIVLDAVQSERLRRILAKAHASGASWTIR